MQIAEEGRRQEVVRRRLVGMGLDARPTPGGRALVVTLALRPDPFETLAGVPRRYASVIFATVGDDRIKCLKPRALFHLPLIRIVDCGSPLEIETRIRTAWQVRLEALRRARHWLEKLGTEVQVSEDEPVLAFSIGVEDRHSLGRVIEPSRVVLPGRGPLSGVSLRRAEDRVFPTSPSWATSLDLELAVTTRLEELARLDARLQREERLLPKPEVAPPHAAPRQRPARILVVGGRLAGERALLESLRLRAYETVAVRTAQEALKAFETTSPELVLAETHLGRFEGIELIPSLRAIPGIEEVPVILVDDRMRPERREASRKAGAAGYLVRPIEVSKIAAGISSLVRQPKRRRFKRYPERLSVRHVGGESAFLTGDVGRGGMFLWTDRELPFENLERYSITLPVIGESLGVKAEVVHRCSVPGSGRRGAGLRFHGFDTDGEARWIRYLRSLEHIPTA
ncbi:MAG TPA: response regulator [Myxococcota bacterium]|nr:response regulator [Myxococcota bacterium]